MSPPSWCRRARRSDCCSSAATTSPTATPSPSIPMPASLRSRPATVPRPGSRSCADRGNSAAGGRRDCPERDVGAGNYAAGFKVTVVSFRTRSCRLPPDVRGPSGAAIRSGRERDRRRDQIVLHVPHGRWNCQPLLHGAARTASVHLDPDAVLWAGRRSRTRPYMEGAGVSPQRNDRFGRDVAPLRPVRHPDHAQLVEHLGHEGSWVALGGDSRRSTTW